MSDPLNEDALTKAANDLVGANANLNMAIAEGEAAARRIEECRDQVNKCQLAIEQVLENFKAGACKITHWGQQAAMPVNRYQAQRPTPNTPNAEYIQTEALDKFYRG